LGNNARAKQSAALRGEGAIGTQRLRETESSNLFEFASVTSVFHIGSAVKRAHRAG